MMTTTATSKRKVDTRSRSRSRSRSSDRPASWRPSSRSYYHLAVPIHQKQPTSPLRSTNRTTKTTTISTNSKTIGGYRLWRRARRAARCGRWWSWLERRHWRWRWWCVELRCPSAMMCHREWRGRTMKWWKRPQPLLPMNQILPRIDFNLRANDRVVWR